MPIREKDGQKEWLRREPAKQYAIWAGWMLGGMLFVWCWALISENTIWEFLYDADEQAASLIGRMIPPDWSITGSLMKPLWDTINIATVGTALGILIAFPLAFLAARNTTPHASLRAVALAIIVSSRSINALIWAMLLVTIVGPGIFAGMLAIALRSIGFVGKLLYEAIEEIHPTPVEAITATGASGPQVLAYSVWPQILPAFAGISVYRWDINIREATTLGLVGAGGIGLQMNAAINNLAWAQVATVFVLIFATVVLSEWVSAKVRHAVI
ncbi:MAG TPA: phosphonate ABC transporter, permease protein PhnE [Pseudohongiella sp.]|nr:phosphonate ABC transporter, permease protein PhnE [Pseudohongiella sp.]MEC8859051.1 phosphonate ABC transporter, permease protein PhnE [Pseudomonadota bacterium]HBX38847.1 phosphonate ABC transporter, permease protein PhnE [Pseudohongiella sp.]|tara:strand:+ start:17813 stop:18625 length:813 start_codon:yes stop_codon:yes gene_type:complete